jgi:hypothetical protein
VLGSVETADWTEPTIPSWRHSIWVGIYDPWIVIFKLNPFIWCAHVKAWGLPAQPDRQTEWTVGREGWIETVANAATTCRTSNLGVTVFLWCGFPQTDRHADRQAVHHCLESRQWEARCGLCGLVV